MKNYLLFFLFIFACSKIFSQAITKEELNEYKNTANEIVRSALTEKWGYRLLGELSEIGPRLSGSENSYKAIYWAEEKMKEVGFDSVWLQPVMVPHWVRGNIEEAEIVSLNYDNKNLKIAALGGSIGTDEDGITAEVLEVKNFEELDSLKEKAKDKIIFFSRSLDPGLVNTFSGYGGAVNQRSSGAIEAAKHGALGVIVRSITTKYDNVPHVGAMNYVDSLPKIPSAAIGFLDADFLSDALKKDPNLKINLKLSCRILPDTLSYNVIGDLLGSEFPNEIIIVSGHLDSWDAGDGAHDDGAGCIQALEVIDLFKRLNIKPKKTIRCIFYINEENGIRGGKKYAEYADSSDEVHTAAIESDRGAFTPVGFNVTADSLIIERIKSWLPVLENAGIEWVKKGESGADIYYINNAKALIGYVPDDQRYFDFHHSANDVYEEIHPREMELGSAAIALLAYLLSEEGL